MFSNDGKHIWNKPSQYSKLTLSTGHQQDNEIYASIQQVSTLSQEKRNQEILLYIDSLTLLQAQCQPFVVNISKLKKVLF